jgi:histidine decarboxylase
MSYDPWFHYERRFSCEASHERLNALHLEFAERSSNYIGFPNSRLFSFRELDVINKYNINNIGDPCTPNLGINVCDYERDVISFWAEHFHLDPLAAWGYITTGSTEAIMYGILQGRDRFADAVLVFSAESHYCLHKIAHILRLPFRIVSSHSDGTLNLDSLAQTISQLDGRPFILNLTVGTTFHGAIEPPQMVLELLEQLHCENFHLHVDAALYGPMLAWIAESPLFDFRLPIDSLSFSGHKFLGIPTPCGVVLCQRQRIRPFAGSAEYVGSLDTTISSSRSGLPTLMLWLVIQKLGRQGFAELAMESLAVANEASSRIKAAGLNVLRHEHGCILVFRRPIDELCRRWHLGTRGNSAHIVTVPGVSSDMIGRFLEEFRETNQDSASQHSTEFSCIADTTF